MNIIMLKKRNKSVKNNYIIQFIDCIESTKLKKNQLQTKKTLKKTSL